MHPTYLFIATYRMFNEALRDAAAPDPAALAVVTLLATAMLDANGAINATACPQQSASVIAIRKSAVLTMLSRRITTVVG